MMRPDACSTRAEESRRQLGIVMLVHNSPPRSKSSVSVASSAIRP